MSIKGAFEVVELGEEGTFEVCGIPLWGKTLDRLKRKAFRAGVWFVLRESQQKLINLVIKVVEKVRSPFLARVLEPIIKRLLGTMGSTRDVMEAVVGRVAYWMRHNGLGLAQKVSRIAQGWGNKSAVEWPLDKDFIQYLCAMDLNKPLGSY